MKRGSVRALLFVIQLNGFLYLSARRHLLLDSKAGTGLVFRMKCLRRSPTTSELTRTSVSKILPFSRAWARPFALGFPNCRTALVADARQSRPSRPPPDRKRVSVSAGLNKGEGSRTSSVALTVVQRQNASKTHLLVFPDLPRQRNVSPLRYYHKQTAQGLGN